MNATLYLIVLFVSAALFVLWERLSPARQQPLWREKTGSDLLFALSNALIVGPVVVLSWQFALEALVGALPSLAVLRVAAHWPAWLQVIVVLVTADFIQWSIHQRLHRIPQLWRLHRVHHSISDHQMDWLVSLRFHWGEQLVYTSILCLPLYLVGFSSLAILVHNISVVLFGYFNHANINAELGPLRYLFNSPKMHLWHHEAASHKAKNFGVVFSCWDWIFGTAYLPPTPPAHLEASRAKDS